MVRKFIRGIIIIVIIICVGIVSKDLIEKDSIAGNSRFINPQGFSESASIIIDTKTKVMYLWKTDSYKGGLTVMLNADGKPLLYEEGE